MLGHDDLRYLCRLRQPWLQLLRRMHDAGIVHRHALLHVRHVRHRVRRLVLPWLHCRGRRNGKLFGLALLLVVRLLRHRMREPVLSELHRR